MLLLLVSLEGEFECLEVHVLEPVVAIEVAVTRQLQMRVVFSNLIEYDCCPI